MTDAKTCGNEACGKPFTRRTTSRETKAAFAARPYCCRACKIAASRISAGTKTCKTCEKPYEKRPRESRNEFMGRRFCSIDCRNQAGGNGRVLPRRTPALIEVTREPGKPWRPAGWPAEPNVHGTVRQAC